MTLLPFVLLGGLVVASALCALVTHRAIRRAQHEAALHAPLLDSDAQERALICSVCAFENASRNAHCSLCGAALAPPSEQAAASSSLSSVWRVVLGIWRRITRKSSPEEVQHEDLVDGSIQFTKRQQRARNRKEWTRAISDDLKSLVWRRQLPADQSSVVASLNHGYVVRFDVTSDVSLDSRKRDSNPDLDASEDSNGSYLELGDDYGEAAEEILGVETEPDSIVDASTDEIVGALAELELVVADDGDEAMPASTSSTKSPAVFASLSALDFPSKNAHFVTEASALLGAAATQPRVPLKISRDNAYDESMAVLSHLPSESLRAPINVQFEGESGIDAGGLFRDWLTLMSSGLVASTTTNRSGEDDNKRTTVFERTDTADEAFHLRGSYFATQEDTKATREEIESAFGAGRFIGRALLEGYPLGFHLSLPLLKLMVGVPISFSDLEFLDCESHRSLMWLLENDGVDALCLDFTTPAVSAGGDGDVATVDLVPGGAAVAVTDANKREFVLLKFRHLVFSRVETVLYPFVKGVFEVVPMDLLAMFDPEELDYVLSGSDEVDVADWRRNTKYTADLHGHMAMRWFWELVEEMPNEYRRRLLRFSTGSSRVPLGGFAALTSYDGRLSPFTLKGVSWMSSGGYIRSHACFNRLDLPLYVDRDDLKRMLFALVESDDAEGFTMA